jgi:hypothetical protein
MGQCRNRGFSALDAVFLIHRCRRNRQIRALVCWWEVGRAFAFEIQAIEGALKTSFSAGGMIGTTVAVVGIGRARRNRWVSTGGAMKGWKSEFDDLGAVEDQRGQLGCACGRHRSQREHDYEAHRMLECVPVARERRRFDGLLAGEAIRTHFTKR